MPEDGPQGKPVMRLEEFLDLIRACSLMEDDLPHNAVINAFVNSVLEDPTMHPAVSDEPPNVMLHNLIHRTFLSLEKKNFSIFSIFLSLYCLLLFVCVALQCI